jgi:lysophospholipase L1-like esterase
MRHCWIIGAVLVGCLVASGSTAQDPSAVPASTSPKQVPYEPAEKIFDGKVDPRFLRAHASFLDRIKSGPIGVLFVGDSITAGWTKNRELFNQKFGSFQPANFGVSGDRTQHVLWRFENGELDISPPPKVVVLMIGTNNVKTDTAADIDKGTEAIVNRVRTKHPTTKVLLLGVLPMGVDPKDPAVASLRQKVSEINERLKVFADGSNIVFLDFGDKLLNENGTTSAAMRADGVHLEARGYEIWAESIAPVLATMMK